MGGVLAPTHGPSTTKIRGGCNPSMAIQTPMLCLFDKYPSTKCLDFRGGMPQNANAWCWRFGGGEVRQTLRKKKWPYWTIELDFEGSSNSPGRYKLHSGTPISSFAFSTRRNGLPTPRHQLRPREFVENAWLCCMFAVALAQQLKWLKDIEGMIGKLFVSPTPFQHRRCSIGFFERATDLLEIDHDRSKVESACQFNLTFFLIVLGGASDLMWPQSGSTSVLQESCFGLCGWHPSAFVPCLPGQR